jgi:hypothetical protein
MFFQKGGPFYLIAAVSFIYAFLGMLLIRLKNSRKQNPLEKDKLGPSALNMGLQGMGVTSEIFFLLIMFDSAETFNLGLVIVCSRAVNFFASLIVVFSLLGPASYSSHYVSKIDHKHLLDNQVAYGLLAFVALFDVNLMRLLPWTETNFVRLSLGYPDIHFVRLCVFTKIVVSLTSLATQSYFLNTFVLQGENEKFISRTSLVYLFINLTVLLVILCVNLIYCSTFLRKMRSIHDKNVDLGIISDTGKDLASNPIFQFFFGKPEIIPSKAELEFREEEKRTKEFQEQLMKKVDIVVETGIGELETRLIAAIRQIPFFEDLPNLGMRESAFVRLVNSTGHDEETDDEQLRQTTQSLTNEVRLTDLYLKERSSKGSGTGVRHSEFEMVPPSHEEIQSLKEIRKSRVLANSNSTSAKSTRTSSTSALHSNSNVDYEAGVHSDAMAAESHADDVKLSQSKRASWSANPMIGAMNSNFQRKSTTDASKRKSKKETDGGSIKESDDSVGIGEVYQTAPETHFTQVDL